MQSARIVYIIIGVMALMPIIYFGLRAALKRKKLGEQKRYITYMAMTAVGCVLAIAAAFGLYQYSLNSLPMLVMERTVRTVASQGNMQGSPLLSQGASVDRSRSGRIPCACAGDRGCGPQSPA